MSEENKSKSPEIVFRDGTLSVNVWKNVNETTDGTKEFFSVTWEKSYKNKSNEWQKTSTLMKNDLLRLAKLLEKAHEFLSIKVIKKQGE